jgi:hypothetical protein
VSASSSIVPFHLPLDLALSRASYPTTIIIFGAVRAVLKNTVHKMWKCAASAASSIEGMNELTCVFCHIFIDFKNVSELL